MSSILKQDRKHARSRRTHAMTKTSGRPRLVVNRSNAFVYAQIVDDSQNKVVCGTSSLKIKETGVAAAKTVGKTIADLAKKNKITQVAFDRNGFAYHGQIKALAESAREAGLDF